MVNKFPTFRDSRGTIENICENADVLRIRSAAGSRRAGHYHKTTGHWCLVTKGFIQYYERAVGATTKPTVRIYNVGDVFWTGPMLEHLMVFPYESEFLCFSTGKRDKESYESDLVRLDFDLDKV